MTSPRRRSSLSQEIKPDFPLSHHPSSSSSAVVIDEEEDSDSQTPKKRTTFTLGSRSSQLALVQTHIVRDALQELHPDYEFKIVTMNTAGDNNQAQALYLLQSKALWTTELEAALHTNQIDLIVHSLKDIPTVLEPEFVITAVLERADPHDALVMKAGLEGSYKRLEDLPEGSVVGTSSVRRVAGLRRDFPKLKFMDVRGNLNTRLRKLDSPTSPFTCLILAAAGLQRINHGHRCTSLVPPPYAVGQGALGVEIRSSDEETKALCAGLGHYQTLWATAAERALLRLLEGGCSVPVAVTSHFEQGPGCDKTEGPGRLSLLGRVTSLGGEEQVEFEIREREVKDFAGAEALGVEVARGLLEKGAGRILKQIEDHKNAKGTVKSDDVLLGSPTSNLLACPGMSIGVDVSNMVNPHKKTVVGFKPPK